MGIGQPLSRAHAEGLGIIVKEALANGQLTDRNADPHSERQIATLQDEARRLGTSIYGLALASVLAQPWADVVLSGAARVDHLACNLAALQVAWDDQAAERLRTLVEPADVYWARRRALLWN